MPMIFVNTDNSHPDDKIYNASRAGKSVATAEGIMQKVVIRIVNKSAGFTTNKIDKAKGYTIRLQISKLEVADHKTKCSLSGSIVRYPKGVTKEQGTGDEMLSLGWAGSATADGTMEGSLLDCVESIVESMMTKGVLAMRADFLKQ